MHDYDRTILATLIRLAADMPTAFGMVIQALFIQSGIEGVQVPPKLQARDPSKLTINDIVRALPVGAGAALGRRALGLALKVTKDRNKAEDVLGTVATKIIDGRAKLHPGTSLSTAKSYILKAVSNTALDLLRAEQRRREAPLVRNEGPEIDLADPRSLTVLETLPRMTLRRVLHDVARVHPRAEAYLQSALQGLSKTEIAKMWGTTPAYVSKWFATCGPKMEQVVEHHLRSSSSTPTRVAMRFLGLAISM